MNNGDLSQTGSRPLPNDENWDTPQGQQTRVNLCNTKLRDTLEEFGCVLDIPILHLSAGRILPEIRIVPAPPKPSNVINQAGRR